MKSAIIALAIFGCAFATSTDEAATIVRSINEQSPDGSTFNNAFETDNGIINQAQGSIKVLNKDEIALTITGTNEYKSPEGQVFQLAYTADENGYRPQGAHLPTTPAPQPIPDYILKSLEYIASHTYVEKKQ